MRPRGNKRRISAEGRLAISKAQKARWAKKKKESSLRPYQTSSFAGLGKTVILANKPIVEVRSIETETNRTQTGNSAAYSSKQSLFFHDIPPVFYRRVALRHTTGHKKYNNDPVPITMNLNWRTGLDDPLYVMDRLNHLFEHLINFLESGNTNDDNLGAIGWCVCFLMECERLHPDVLQQVIGQCAYSGKRAEHQKQLMQHANLVSQTISELNSDPINAFTSKPPIAAVPAVKTQGNARKAHPRRKKSTTSRRDYANASTTLKEIGL